jgi:PAS domain S-box-containing protein
LKSFIFKLLLDRFGTDFRHYKNSTIERRIRRRYGLCGLGDLQEYADLLVTDPDELSDLYDDLLIDVTAFFRDKEAFEILEKNIIPDIASRMSEDEQVRIWVPACSSGEEPYSIAILITEYALNNDIPLNMKIMATDIHHRSLEAAGEGIYSEESLKMMSPERVTKYFKKHGKKYQIIPDIRRCVVFSPHNLFSDPPFTRMDLVSCRNMLIYLQEPAQHKAIALFHFALNKDGYVFLGPSETVGRLSHEFEIVNQRWRMFKKKRDVRLVESTTILRTEDRSAASRTPLSSAVGQSIAGRNSQLDQPEIRRAFNKAIDSLLTQYAPTGFLITRLGELVHIFGDAGHYINISAGGFSQRLIDLIHKDLKIAVAAGLERMKGFVSDSYVRRTTITYETGEVYGITISMEGLPDSVGTIDFLLVTVKRDADVKQDITEIDTASIFDMDTMNILQGRIHELERDLSSTEESLQTTIEELETSNEELQATNEELMASNEELQSTNEELHSVNEELYTVSTEHQRKIEELTDLTNDMDQLLRCTDIGTIFVGSDLTIRRFTPAAMETFNLYAHDIGRPLEHITHKFDSEVVNNLISRVRETEMVAEEELSVDGHHYLLRVLPYKPNLTANLELVITIIDVDELRQAAKKVENTANFYREILGDITDFVVRWEMPSGKITYINEAYKKFVEEFDPSWNLENIYDSYAKGRRGKKTRETFENIEPGGIISHTHIREFDNDQTFHLAGQIRSIPNADRTSNELQWSGHDISADVKYQHALLALLEIDQNIDLAVEERFNRIIEIGIEYFDLEYGILLKGEGKSFKLEGYHPVNTSAVSIGSTLELPNNNIFKRVTKQDGLIAETNIKKGKHKNYSFATHAKCTTFIGMPIYQNSEQYGLIGFYSKSGRSHVTFSEADKNFIHLLARWIGFKIEARDQLNQLKSNEAELQFIFDNMPARIWYKDDKNGILRLNKVAAESMGLTVEEATGASTYDLFPEMAKKYHEDDLKVFNSGEPLLDIIEEYTPKDKERGWVSTDKIPFKDVVTNERRLLVSSKDITNIKEQESLLIQLNQELEEQQEHYRKLYNRTPVMMHSFNKKGEILEVSDQWINKLGYTRDEVIGKKPTDFMTPESRNQFAKNVSNFWEMGSVDALPYVFLKKDGSTVDIEVSGLVDKTDKKQIRSLGVLIDVTERNRARDELEKKNIELEQAIESLSQFAYVASHDLQEPLRKIQQFGELLQADCADVINEEGQYFLSSMMSSAERMSSLIRALLQYSKTTQGTFEPKKLDFKKLISNVQGELDQRISETKAKITIGDIPDFSGDEIMVRQLFANLIGNALKYRRDANSPRIRISSRKKNGGIILTLADNGVGIENQFLEQIFEPFTRLNNAGTQKGSGIGLAICRTVCDRHGWKIEAESELGKGTKFKITIPNL